MKPKTLIDTGPLVAFLNRKEKHHAWIVRELGLIESPLYTCEAVISEACYLLMRIHSGPIKLLELISRGLLRCHFDFNRQSHAVTQLMKRYDNIPMTFADACLVCMVDTLNAQTLFTFDSDFTIYRQRNRQHIPVRSPT